MFDLALLVLTDATGIERIQAETENLPSMALRPDQREATQILFMDAESRSVEFVALLHAAQPFVAMPDGSFTPHVVEFMPLMEPIAIDRYALNTAWSMGSMPELDIEAVNIDPDELEVDLDYLGAQLVDEVIINRRDFNHEAVKRSLLEAGHNSFVSTRATLEALLQGS